MIMTIKAELNYKLQNARQLNDSVINAAVQAIDNMRLTTEQNPKTAAMAAFNRLPTATLEELYKDITGTTTANGKISFIVKRFFADEMTNLKHKMTIMKSLDCDSDGKGAMNDVVKMLLVNQYMQDGIMKWKQMEDDINEKTKNDRVREAAQQGRQQGQQEGYAQGVASTGAEADTTDANMSGT